MSQTEETIINGAEPFLDAGEHARAALYATPFGWPPGRGATGMAAASLILELLNKKKRQATLEAAASVGFSLTSPVGLVVTDKRLVCLELGKGLRTTVVGALGQAALAVTEVAQVKRASAGTRISVAVSGTPFMLDLPPFSDTAGFLREFAAAKEGVTGRHGGA